MKTRLKALMKQIDSGQMKSDIVRILDYIMKNEMSSPPMISDALNIPIVTVRPRCTNLLDMGIIEVVESDADHEILKHQKDSIRVAKNAYERKKAKFDQWRKRGLNEFSEFLNENQLEFDL